MRPKRDKVRREGKAEVRFVILRYSTPSAARITMCSVLAALAHDDAHRAS